jgi:phenylacetate-coenzyme A ligase PaaK-like adenylate-forming protein
VIDPQTAEPVDEGTRGELVVTTLSRAGMPVLRYRTGDLVELSTEPCMWSNDVEDQRRRCWTRRRYDDRARRESVPERDR